MGKSGSLGQDSLAEDLVVIMVFVYDDSHSGNIMPWKATTFLIIFHVS
jgi:hypothetical protein